jgi:hypothetical protein
LSFRPCLLYQPLLTFFPCSASIFGAEATSGSAVAMSSKRKVSRNAIADHAATTNSLQELRSADQRKVMDMVDKLRRTGLSGIVELPQLVVCGDQSSGKSSVLEAITEIPFPRKENLCTRFATEVSLQIFSLAL